MYIFQAVFRIKNTIRDIAEYSNGIFWVGELLKKFKHDMRDLSHDMFMNLLFRVLHHNYKNVSRCLGFEQGSSTIYINSNLSSILGAVLKELLAKSLLTRGYCSEYFRTTPGHSLSSSGARSYCCGTSGIWRKTAPTSL